MFNKLRIAGISLFLFTVLTILVTGCGGTADSPSLTLVSTTSATSAPTNTISAPTTATLTTAATNPGTRPVPTTTAVKPSSTAIPTSPLTAQEIAIKSVTTTETIKTLKFDMNFTMVFGLGMSGSTETMNMQQIATAAVNFPDKKMAMTMDMVMKLPEEGQQNISAELYTIDGWMYMKANVPDAAAQWSKMKLTDEVWAQQSQLASLTDFLKSPLNLGLVGSENIKGIDCYVLNISPNENSLANWMSGQMQNGDGGPSLDDLGMSQLFNNFAVKQWIAKNSLLPVRQQIAMKFDSQSGTPEATPNIFDQMGTEINATIDYYDYNKDVNIQLPLEALNAQEITQ